MARIVEAGQITDSNLSSKVQFGACLHISFKSLFWEYYYQKPK